MERQQIVFIRRPIYGFKESKFNAANDFLLLIFKNMTCLCLYFTPGIRRLCSSNIHMNRMAGSLEGKSGTYAEQGRKISRPRCEGFSSMGFLPRHHYSNTT